MGFLVLFCCHHPKTSKSKKNIPFKKISLSFSLASTKNKQCSLLSKKNIPFKKYLSLFFTSVCKKQTTLSFLCKFFSLFLQTCNQTLRYFSVRANCTALELVSV